jgi:hypothetical protein
MQRAMERSCHSAKCFARCPATLVAICCIENTSQIDLKPSDFNSANFFRASDRRVPVAPAAGRALPAARPRTRASDQIPRGATGKTSRWQKQRLRGDFRG